MKTLGELASRRLSGHEMCRDFANFGSCDFCDRKGHTCRYRYYVRDGRYIEGLICDWCHMDMTPQDGSPNQKAKSHSTRQRKGIQDNPEQPRKSGIIRPAR